MACAVTAQLARARLSERLVGQESRHLPGEDVPDFGRRRFDLLLDDGATIGNSSEKDDPVGKRVQPLGHEANRLQATQQHGRPR